MVRIQKALNFLGQPVVKQKIHNNTLTFRFNSEIPPTKPLRLKVEINTREHFNVLGLIQQDFSVNSSWYSGTCKITTYQFEELLGTKVRALYQRRKGRDLFDLQKALENPNINPDNVVKCYREYIEFSDGESPSQTVYLANMEEKMQEEIFLNDTQALLRPSLTFNPQEAYEIVKSKLIEKI